MSRPVGLSITQTQSLQPSLSPPPPPTPSWGTQHVRSLSSRASPDMKFREKDNSTSFFVRSVFAGGMAGCAAKTLIAPLDRIKILFQTGNPEFKPYAGSVRGMARGLVKIWQTSGVWGLYQGHSATLLRVFPYAAIKFVAYDQIRDHLIPSQAEEVWYRRLAAGSLAGVTSVFFTYPLELVRVRLAFETQSSSRIKLRNICSKIYHERDFPIHQPAQPQPHLPFFGLTNFYRGFIPTIAGMIPYAGVSFWAHDAVGDILRSPRLAPYTLANVPPRNERERRHPKLSNGWEFVAGGIAGIMAQTSSYPIEVVRRRMQVGGAVGNHEMRKFMDVVRQIYATAGIRGFYVGLSIGYIKVGPMVACSFVVWEQMKYWLDLN